MEVQISPLTIIQVTLVSLLKFLLNIDNQMQNVHNLLYIMFIVSRILHKCHNVHANQLCNNMIYQGSDLTKVKKSLNPG